MSEEKKGGVRKSQLGGGQRTSRRLEHGMARQGCSGISVLGEKQEVFRDEETSKSQLGSSIWSKGQGMVGSSEAGSVKIGSC